MRAGILPLERMKVKMVKTKDTWWLDGTLMGDMFNNAFDSAERLFDLKENKRARKKDGTFVADNPSTSENEAWTKGKAPTKKKTRKKVSKKK